MPCKHLQCGIRSYLEIIKMTLHGNNREKMPICIGFFPDLIIGWNSKVLFTILLFNLSKRQISTLTTRILNQGRLIKANILLWLIGEPDFFYLSTDENILDISCTANVYRDLQGLCGFFFAISAGKTL